jgi:hypothetical protein
MIGNIALRIGAGYLKGKARRKKEKRDLAEEKLAEKRQMDNTISLFQTKLDLQTKANADAERLTEEKDSTKKFKELSFIFKEHATDMEEFYGMETALQLGKTMQKNSINSGEPIKNMYSIDKIENVQPNMDTLQGMSEDNRGVRIQTTDAFQTAGVSDLNGLKQMYQMQFGPLMESGANLETDPKAIELRKNIENIRMIENITAAPKQGLSVSQLATVTKGLENIGRSFFPDLNESYRDGVFVGSDDESIQNEFRMFTKIITDYGNTINNYIKAEVDPSMAFTIVQKEMENSFKRGDFKLVSQVNPLVASLPEENQASALALVDKIKSTNDTSQVAIYKRELMALGYTQEEVDSL